MKALLAVLLLTLSASAWAGSWQLVTRTDEMTDQASQQAVITSADGDTFTLMRRSDGTVWGYLKLSGTKQFGVGMGLMFRVDKNKPAKYSEQSAMMVAQLLGGHMDSWQWNPSLIGVRLWGGVFSVGCGVIRQLYYGHQLIIRYYPNQSTFRDIKFELSGNPQAITQAIGISIAQCPAGK